MKVIEYDARYKQDFIDFNSAWSENEYELNKTYAFNTVEFSSWLTELRKAILEDTLDKINNEK